MRRGSRQAEKRRAQPALTGRLLLLPLLALVVTTAGCQGTDSHPKDEPFFGPSALSLRQEPPYNHRPGDASAVPPPPKPPPAPSAHSLTSTATAAGQQGDGRDGTVPIPPPPAPTGATLAAPQALEGTTSRSGPIAPVAAASGPVAAAAPQATGGTFEQLQTQLKQRGLRYQWLQQGDESGEWKFTCSVLTDPSNPNLLTTYRQSSFNDCGVGAMRDVLQKIDQDRAKAR